MMVDVSAAEVAHFFGCVEKNKVESVETVRRLIFFFFSWWLRGAEEGLARSRPGRADLWPASLEAKAQMWLSWRA